MIDNLYFKESSSELHSSNYGLYATPVAALPFLKNVVVRSFLLERPQGNILIYNSPGINKASKAIKEMGDPNRLLVNHHHEAMYGAPDFELPIWIHENDKPMADMGITDTFSSRHMINDDLEVIPTPGHTQGTTTFLWDNGEQRFLFPGDAIWVQGGQWKAVLLGDSDRSAYLDSLALLKELDFDFIVPWGVEMGSPSGYAVSKDEGISIFDSIISRLKAGKNY